MPRQCKTMYLGIILLYLLVSESECLQKCLVFSGFDVETCSGFLR